MDPENCTQPEREPTLTRQDGYLIQMGPKPERTRVELIIVWALVPVEYEKIKHSLMLCLKMSILFSTSSVVGTIPA